MIYLLFLVTCLMTVAAYYGSDQEILAPGVIFAGGFAFSELWALSFVKQWKLNLHFNTFIVLVGGIGCFLLGAMLIHLFFKKKRPVESRVSSYGGTWGQQEIVLNRWLLWALVALEGVTMAVTIFEMREMVGGNNLFQTIAAYRQRTTFTAGGGKLPSYVYFFRALIMAEAYWMAYVIANNALVKKRVPLLPSVIFVIALLNSMLFGSRGGAINIMIALIVCFGIIYGKQNGKLRISWKLFLALVILAAIVLLSFRTIGNMMGRNSHVIPLNEYLAEYLGAQIKNLDSFLNEVHPRNYIWGQQTFSEFIKWIGPKFGLNTHYQLYLPMRFVGRYHLGNVCTTFAAFYMDFSYAGVFILSVIMGLVSQTVFELTLRTRLSGQVDYMTVLYGYIYPALVFSFFSNRFYSQIVSPLFIKCVFLWWAYNIVFCYWDESVEWVKDHLPGRKDK